MGVVWRNGWGRFGESSGSCWGNLGIILGKIRGHVWQISRQFRFDVGVILGKPGGHLGEMLGSVWGNVGLVLGNVRGHVGVMLRKSGGHFGEGCRSCWRIFRGSLRKFEGKFGEAWG